MNRYSHSLRQLLLLALGASLGGCAAWPAGPARPATPVAPSAWQSGSAAAAAAPVSSPTEPWWQALQDPQLDALQVLALQANLEAQGKALQWQEALARARIYALNRQPAPGLGVNTDTTRALESGETSVLVDGVSVPVSGAARTSRSFSVQANLGYEVDFWSKLAQGANADHADAESRREDWRDARWLVSAKVAEAYWNIAAIDAKLPMLTELVQSADEAVRIAHLQMKEGKLRADEVDVVITRQYEARKDLADARADRRLELHQLALLLDRDPSALPPGEARLPAGEPTQPALGTPAQTLERRPDVRQARLAVDAALARLHVAEASRYPTLRMNLNLRTNGRTWRDWFSQPLASLGLSLAVPLVDWRRLDAERDVARYTLDGAALVLRRSVREALMDVEDALLERERWQQGWAAAQAQRAEKEKVHANARLRQEVGHAGRLEVLQSRQAVLQAQMKIVDLRLKAWVNLLKLYKALGGAV